jgi:hypothetical protein
MMNAQRRLRANLRNKENKTKKDWKIVVTVQ